MRQIRLLGFRWRQSSGLLSPVIWSQKASVVSVSSIHQKRQVQQMRREPVVALSNSSANYCMNLVKKHDHENFLCTLLLRDPVHRRHAFALRAFNVEVAKCALNVSESHIVQMRIRFWLDAIDKCYEDKASYVDDQPVLSELKNALDMKKLNRVYLKRMVSARDRQPKEQFRTLEEIQQYAEQSYSSLFYLLLESMGVKDLNADHAASHLGKAQGLTTLLRAIPHLNHGFQLHVPQELLQKHGLNGIGGSDQGQQKAMEECIFEIASLANQHITKTRLLMDKIPKSALRIFLPAVPVDRYLERLRLAKFNDTLLPLVLFLHSFRGTF